VKAGFVSFLGRPNAGKSTLLNRIVGHKLAIVSDKPQTTRTRIVGVKNYEQGQVVFVDTRETLMPADWANELHPTPAGFKKLAQKWAPKLKSAGLAS